MIGKKIESKIKKILLFTKYMKLMRNILQGNTEYKQYDKMFENITDISFSKNIAPFSTDSQDIVSMGRHDHIDESNQIKHWKIGPFIRTVIMNLPLTVHTLEGKSIDVNCKIWSRTMQNIISDDIIKNMRKAWSINLLDMDFEFAINAEE